MSDAAIDFAPELFLSADEPVPGMATPAAGAHWPLAHAMRPRTLEEIAGQQHILAPGTLLERAVRTDSLTSAIFYGPPGTGKTTLAEVIASITRRAFCRLSAVAASVQDVRQVIAFSRRAQQAGKPGAVLFLDEIHRFNKAQQDVLMPDVENGILVLIGATTMNPFFSLVTPLLSRSLVFELKPLGPLSLMVLLERALLDAVRGLGRLPVKADKAALEFLADISDGDARRALNALEIGCLSVPKNEAGEIVFDLAAAQESIQKKQVQYDGDGDVHYDTISAFIKSMRGSDPDAALYWLAKMIYAGEDPRFIARRIVICAAEDVGNADPQALVLANTAAQASEFIGFPEARIILAQAVTYVACAPKSNAAYLGIDRALEDVRNKKAGNVPSHLKDASYAGAKKLGHGQGYKYAHDFPDHYVPQEYMPFKATYYEPTDLGYEKKIRDRLEVLRKRAG